MQELPHTHSCFVCGDANSIGLRLRFQTDGQTVRAEFVPRPEHAGFKQLVHGGLLATVLDEAMVWGCAVQTGHFAYCAELTVRFQKPLPPGEATIVTAELVANRRNRVFDAKAELRDSRGSVLATATGKYLPVKPAELASMLDDLVGDATVLRLR